MITVFVPALIGMSRLARAVAATALLVLVLAAPGTTSGASLPATESQRQQIKLLVIEEAEATAVPPALALAVAKVGSDFQPQARSTKDARGVMQVGPEVAERVFDVDPDALFAPRRNIRIGLRWLERLFERHGDWERALAHHHAGTVAAPAGGAHPLVGGYVDTVSRWQERYAAQQAVWADLDRRERELGTGFDHTSPDPDVARPPLDDVTSLAGGSEERRRPSIFRWFAAEPASGDLPDIERRRLLAGPYLDDFSPSPSRLQLWEN